MDNDHALNVQLEKLACALNDIRDSWQILGLLLLDQLAEQPNYMSEKAMLEVQRAIENIKNSGHGQSM